MMILTRTEPSFFLSFFLFLYFLRSMLTAVIDKTKLYCLGQIDLLNSNNTIAIIGTRDCTSEGRQIAYQIGYALARKDYTVMTGLAKGIDMLATSGSLDAKGKVIAVRPYLYPLDYVNDRLLKKITVNGCIISENLEKVDDPLWIRVQLFLRNRIISALARAIVLVEARYDKHSGTMHQLKFLYQNGSFIKPVYVWQPVSKREDLVKGFAVYVARGAVPFRTVDELVRVL
jgi:DNA processing protein